MPANPEKKTDGGPVVDKRDPTGGPAFPWQFKTIGHHGLDGLEQVTTGGISIRDYFAGQALAGMLAELFSEDRSEVARMAYAIADAMLARRSK